MKSEPNFWKTWVKADEVERLALVKTLTPFQRGGLARYMTASLMMVNQ